MLMHDEKIPTSVVSCEKGIVKRFNPVLYRCSTRALLDSRDRFPPLEFRKEQSPHTEIAQRSFWYRRYSPDNDDNMYSERTILFSLSHQLLDDEYLVYFGTSTFEAASPPLRAAHTDAGFHPVD